MFVSQSNSPAPLSERWPAWSGRRRLFLFAGLGAVGALGHPPLGWPVFTIFSLLALFALRPWQLATKQAAWAGWAYGLGYFGITLHWIVEPFFVDAARHGWMAPFAIVLLAGGLALFWAAAFAIGGARRSGLALVLALSLAELLRAHVFTGFPWGMFVTAFVGQGAYQAAAWVGPYGLTLVLLALIHGATAVPGRWALAGAVAMVTIALSVPMPAADTEGDGPIIRVVQPNASQDLKWREDMIPVFLQRKLDATAALPPADLVIWPEVSLPAWLEQGQGLIAEAAAQGAGASLLIGAQSFRDGQAFNALAQVSPEGTVTARYDKAHLVPFGEYMPLASVFARVGIYGLAANEGFGFAAGPGPAVMEVPGVGLVQPLICYESIFAHGVRAAPERPRLITIVTNDAWFGELGGPAQHLAHARARAIEMGLPVARSANTGISAIIDARGRVLAALPLGEAGHLDHALPKALPPTPYVRFGELPFAGLFLGLLLFYLLVWQRDFD
ncbi:MAG: apolipoprotein N-acyltransferase [Pseudomonadota bacterium]